MFNFSPLSVRGLGYSVPSISLIIYRTKVESSRETPDFVSECMASVLLFVNFDKAMHLDFASLQFFAQKREHLHSTADALYTCSIISNGLYLLFIISFRVLTYVFVGLYLKLLFLLIRRTTFSESLLYPFAFNLKQINGSYPASGFLLISSELSYNLNCQASIL